MRYLCPVCEHELNGKSFCPECRKMVKEPMLFDGLVMPNESSHSVYDYFEDECGHEHRFGIPNFDPHLGKKIKDVFPTGKTGEKAPGPSGHPSKDGRVIPTVQPARAGMVRYSANETGKKTKKNKFPLTVIIIFGLLYLLATLIWAFADSDIFSGGSSYEYSRETLDEQEVLDAGEPCTGYVHYDVMRDDFVAALTAYLGGIWPEAEITVKDSSVDLYEINEITYYEESTWIFVRSTSEDINIEFISDYVTGEIMEVYVDCSDAEMFRQALTLAQYALLGSDYDLEELMSEMNVYYQEFEEDAEGDGYLYVDWWESTMMISGSTTTGGENEDHYAFLDCLEEYGKYK